MSHYGVARDLKAFLDLNNEKVALKQPSISEFTYDDFKIETKIKGSYAFGSLIFNKSIPIANPKNITIM